MCDLPSNMKNFTQNVTKITFIFETSPNTKPKEKKMGGHGVLCPPRLKKGGHVPRIPHQIAPMRVSVDHCSCYTGVDEGDCVM